MSRGGGVILNREQGIFVCGWYENSHRFMKCKLYAQIFMSSVLQTLVDLFSNKLYILSQLPENNLNFVLQGFNRDSLFFHNICSSYKTVYNLPSTFSKCLIYFYIFMYTRRWWIFSSNKLLPQYFFKLIKVLFTCGDLGQLLKQLLTPTPQLNQFIFFSFQMLEFVQLILSNMNIWI